MIVILKTGVYHLEIANFSERKKAQTLNLTCMGRQKCRPYSPITVDTFNEREPKFWFTLVVLHGVAVLIVANSAAIYAWSELTIDGGYRSGLRLPGGDKI